MLNLINDNKGFVSLADAMLSIFVLFMVLIAFNMMIDIEIPSLSEENNDFKTSQNIMEIMSSKADGRDYTILERITFILSENNNSIASKREVKENRTEIRMTSKGRFTLSLALDFDAEACRPRPSRRPLCT